MKGKFRKGIVTLGVMGVLMSSTVIQAASVAGGELNYNGGQTDTKVYSEIQDAKPSNSKKYKVLAIVKRNSSKYTSGWRNDYAYKEIERAWYANETSGYDYFQR